MKDISWDAYQIFLAVARHGGLTGASVQTGLSPATIGRRVLQLEEAAGLALFSRSQTGYVLTADGQALFEQALGMEAASRKLESWREGAVGNVTIRVMAGTWGGRLIAENITAIANPRENIRIDLRIGERRAQLAHRQNDIGIRAVRPDEPNLASRLLSEVAYAPYRLRNAPEYVGERWIAVSEEEAVSPYLRWPHENRSAQIVVSVERARSLLDLLRAGAGTAILPCFVGDLDPGLERGGDEIDTLRHAQWIATNNDDRHRREIRVVTDRIVKLYKSHTDVFAGKRPSRTV